MMYLVRQEHARSFTMTKWEDDMSVLPIATYRLTLNDKNKVACSCPSGVYRGYCKHTKILRDWIARGQPEGLLMDDV
jgi:hypothetical protein